MLIIFFTSIINKRLNEYVESINLIGTEQAGFRAVFSTISHIFVFIAMIQLYLLKRERVYCAFIDFKKALDSINRTKLWSKWLDYNINGKILNVIKSMYNNVKSCVNINGQLSDTFTCSIACTKVKICLLCYLHYILMTSMFI